MRLGFVGTGIIAEAMVDGLCAEASSDIAVTVSPRGAETAARLAARYASVRIATSNQEVVDSADIVVLAIRPQVAEEVVRSLRFKPGQLVVSLVATFEGDQIRAWIDTGVEIVRAVPLPFVAERRGVTVLFPPEPRVEALFARLGTALPCETLDEFDLWAAASALMGTYFGLIDRVVQWLGENGVGEAKARTYLFPLFGSLAAAGEKSASVPLAELRRHFSTKGGLNEQMFSQFEAHGGTAALGAALDSVLTRIRANHLSR